MATDVRLTVGTRRFTYRVVTMNGAGVHGGHFRRCADAKQHAARLAEAERDKRIKLGPYEIERVEAVSTSGSRYWMRRGSRWVLWNPHEDADARAPDWIYEAGPQASGGETLREPSRPGGLRPESLAARSDRGPEVPARYPSGTTEVPRGLDAEGDDG